MSDLEKYPYTSKTGKRYYTYTDDRGDTIRVYESGTHFNEDNNKIVRGFFTRDNAGQMQARMIDSRAQKRLDAARRGVVRGASGVMPNDIFDEYDYIEALAERQAELSLSIDARGTVQAAKLVLDLLDMTPSKRQNLELKQGNQSIRLEGVERGQLEDLLASIRQAKQ